MHVKHGSTDAPWHRLTIDVSRKPGAIHFQFQRSTAETACGEAISSYYATREETYEGDLCRAGCFTPHELAISQRLNEQAHELLRAETEAYEAQRLERQSERALDRERDRLRLDIATGKHPKIEFDDIDDPDSTDPEDSG